MTQTPQSNEPIPTAWKAPTTTSTWHGGKDPEQVEARRRAGCPDPEAPLVVSCGMGSDSHAVLSLFKKWGVRPDLILFADVGGEVPHTYAAIPVLRAWLREAGFPDLTIVRRPRLRMTYYRGGEMDHTLFGNAWQNETLPSLAFGMKGCSLKWKVEPMDKFVKAWAPAKVYRARGKAVVRVIGYDYSPADQKRSKATFSPSKGDRFWYPLRENKIARTGTSPSCTSLIMDIGLDPVATWSAWVWPWRGATREVSTTRAAAPRAWVAPGPGPSTRLTSWPLWRPSWSGSTLSVLRVTAEVRGDQPQGSSEGR
jgi:hypothetical protein